MPGKIRSARQDVVGPAGSEVDEGMIEKAITIEKKGVTNGEADRRKV